MRGMKSSQQKELLRHDLLWGASNSNVFSLSVVWKRLQWKYKLIMILPLWQRVAWMGLVRFQWGLPKSVYNIPLNRDMNKWFKQQFCILYKQNGVTAILLHYIYIILLNTEAMICSQDKNIKKDFWMRLEH